MFAHTQASELKLARGEYYDVEARSKLGDSSFVHVASNGGAVAELSAAFFTEAVLSADGRYGAFGAPTDVRVLSDEAARDATPRLLELSFSAVTPGGALTPRRAVEPPERTRHTHTHTHTRTYTHVPAALKKK